MLEEFYQVRKDYIEYLESLNDDDLISINHNFYQSFTDNPKQDDFERFKFYQCALELNQRGYGMMYAA